MRSAALLALAALLLGACTRQEAVRSIHPLELTFAAPVVKAPGLGPVSAPASPSLALGRPERGRLRRGLLLPEAGPGWRTWDPVLKRSPNRSWRRWGSDRLVVLLARVLGDFRRDHPDVPPVLVGDLSRPRGGIFDRRFGGRGHVSHQNGLDADVYYPRRDRRLRAPRVPGDVDRRLAQELVDRFVAAGAELVLVGPRLRLRGPRRVVQPLVHHDDHLHVRLPLR